MDDINKKYKSHSEYTADELREIGERLMKEREERIAFNMHCERIKNRFHRGELEGLQPHWHVSQEDIDFSNQPHQLTEELMGAGFTVIESVDMETLLDSMQTGNPALYRTKQMFHDDWSQYNICRVLDAWLNNQKLIPPTLILNEELDQTYLADGKHRFNVAYCLHEKTIPIVVPNIHLKRVRQLVLGDG